MSDIDVWLAATVVYCFLALITLLPVCAAMLKRVKFEPRPSPFGDAEKPGDMVDRLNKHFSRMEGVLHYWNIRAKWNMRFHYYILCWTLLVSAMIPVVVTFTDVDSYAKLFLIIISLHSAIMLAFHRALKIENNYKSFRHGKSEFCDMYRRMLDNPRSFGETEDDQLNTYFAEAERIRKSMRSAELDNFPGLDEKQSSAGGGFSKGIGLGRNFSRPRIRPVTNNTASGSEKTRPPAQDDSMDVPEHEVREDPEEEEMSETYEDANPNKDKE